MIGIILVIFVVASGVTAGLIDHKKNGENRSDN